MFREIKPYLYFVKVPVRILIGTAVLLLLSVWGPVMPAAGGDLNANGQWSYGDSSSETATRFQSYNISYYREADITDRIGANGSVRYSKKISGETGSDSVNSSLSLKNFNNLYTLSLTGSYAYSVNEEGNKSASWNWNSSLGSGWTDRLWPKLGLRFSQSGSGSNGDHGPVSSTANLDTSWNYWEWLNLGYTYTWSGSGEDSETARQAANLKLRRSFWKNRGSFSFHQSYDRQESQTSSLITSGGFGLVPVLVSQLYYEEIEDPSDNVLAEDASYLFADEEPPMLLTIDPANEPMNLIVFSASQEIEVVRLYTVEDISSFYEGIAWRLYESQTGTDDWTFVAGATLGSADYDQEEQRITIDFNSRVTSEYVKIVLELPDPVFGIPPDIPPGQITNLERVEVFRKVSGSVNSTVTSTSESEKWASSLFTGFRLTDNIRLGYNSKYDLRQGSNTKERASLVNSASVSWAPNRYFRSNVNVSENRVRVEDAEESIGRGYGLSVSSLPLATLHVSGAFRRNESYSGSRLRAAIHSYSVKIDARLYRDLNGAFDLSYRDPQTEGDGSLSSNISATARLSPALLINWGSGYNLDLDTDSYDLDNGLRLNWRVSASMNMNANLNTDYTSTGDLTNTMGLGLGLSPNNRNRINMNYSITDDETITQAMAASWHWIITRKLNFNFSGTYHLAEENSWSMSGSLSLNLFSR